VYGSDGASTGSPRQTVRICLSPVRLSAAGFAGGLVRQYPAGFVRVLGVCVLLFAQFQLKFQALRTRGSPTSHVWWAMTGFAPSPIASSMGGVMVSIIV
jgi:hypothetical protein